MKKARLQCTILALQDITESHDVDVANLNAQVDALRGDVAQLESRKSNMQYDIDTLAARLAALERRLVDPSTLSWTLTPRL
jgi:TolA-binding protein